MKNKKIFAVLLVGASLFSIFLSVLAAPKDVSGTYPTYIPKTAIADLRESLADAIPLTDAATTTLKIKDGGLFLWVIGGNRILDIVGHRAGRTIYLLIKQDATGSRTVTWDTGIVWAGGAAPTLTTTPNKVDVIPILDTGTIYIGLTPSLAVTPVTNF